MIQWRTALAACVALLVAVAVHAQAPVSVSDEQYIAAAADAAVDGVNAVGAFCHENARDLNYDFEGIARKFTRFKKRQFGDVTFPEATLQFLQVQREQALKSNTQLLAAVKEENGVRPFCRAAYAKWINMDQEQFGEMIRRSYQQYKSRVEEAERRKKGQ